jgi:hypothetical protein
MNTKNIRITKETDDLLEKCRLEYLKHHPEMRHVPLSYDKILYEIAFFYMKM